MRIASRIAICALTVIAAVSLVGCAGQGFFGLEGTRWRLSGWSVSSVEPDEFEITLTFDDGIAGGTSAVNSYGGSYEAKPGGAFRIEEVAGTLMAGEERAMRAEAAYLELLRRARRYQVDGETLTLSDGSGNALLIFEQR